MQANRRTAPHAARPVRRAARIGPDVVAELPAEWLAWPLLGVAKCWPGSLGTSTRPGVHAPAAPGWQAPLIRPDTAANRYTQVRTGCSAAWLARRVWVAEAAGSNPASPTRPEKAARETGKAVRESDPRRRPRQGRRAAADRGRLGHRALEFRPQVTQGLVCRPQPPRPGRRRRSHRRRRSRRRRRGRSHRHSRRRSRTGNRGRSAQRVFHVLARSTSVEKSM